VQRHQFLELIREFRAVLGHAAGEGVLREQRVRQVVRVQRVAEELAVRSDAAEADTAEVHAVIALGAADELRLGRLPLLAPVGTRHLQRGVRGLRARVGEEHVVEPGRRHLFQQVREPEGERVRELEGRRIVELLQLARDGLGDLGAIVTEAAAPQPRKAVEHPPPVSGDVVTALGAHDQPRLLLELPVRRERQPVRLEFLAAERGVHRGRGKGVGHRGLPERNAIRVCSLHSTQCFKNNQYCTQRCPIMKLWCLARGYHHRGAIRTPCATRSLGCRTMRSPAVRPERTSARMPLRCPGST